MYINGKHEQKVFFTRTIGLEPVEIGGKVLSRVSLGWKFKSN
jgi:hypothetical protein